MEQYKGVIAVAVVYIVVVVVDVVFKDNIENEFERQQPSGEYNFEMLKSSLLNLYLLPPIHILSKAF